MIYFELPGREIPSFEKHSLDIWLNWVDNSCENSLSLLLGILLRWVAFHPEHHIVSRLHGRFGLFEVANGNEGPSPLLSPLVDADRAPTEVIQHIYKPSKTSMPVFLVWRKKNYFSLYPEKVDIMENIHLQWLDDIEVGHTLGPEA